MMKPLALAAAFASLAACASTTADPAAGASAAFDAYVAAINAGDTEKAVSFYDDEPGFYWVEHGHIRYRSAGEAADSLRAMASQPGTAKMTINDILVAEMGADAALVSAHFDYGMLDEAGKTIWRSGGWMSLGMVKRENGWKIAAGQTGPGGAD